MNIFNCTAKTVVFNEAVAEPWPLPTDLIHEILSYTNIPTMARLAATSRFFRAEVATFPDFSVRALFLKQVATEAQEALQKELEKCKEIDDYKVRDWEFYITLRKLSRFNPGLALKLVDHITEPYYRDNILAYTLIILGSRDPEGALLLVNEKIDQYSDKTHARCDILCELAKKDMKKSIKLALRITNNDEMFPVLYGLLRTAIKSYPEHIEEIFRLFFDPRYKRDDRHCHCAIIAVAEVNWSLATWGSSFVRFEGLRQDISIAFADNHPEQASIFFDKVEGNNKTLAELYVIHAQSNSVVAKEFLDRAIETINLLSGYEKNSSLGQFASRVVAFDAELAIKIWGQMNTGEEKDGCLLNMLMEMDLESALKLLDKFNRPYYRFLALRDLLPKLILKDPSRVPALIETIEYIDSIDMVFPHLKDDLYGELAAHVAKKALAEGLSILEKIEHPPVQLETTIKIALAIESTDPLEAKKIIANVLHKTKSIDSQIAIATQLQIGLSVRRIFKPYISFAMKGFVKPRQ